MKKIAIVCAMLGLTTTLYQAMPNDKTDAFGALKSFCEKEYDKDEDEYVEIVEEGTVLDDILNAKVQEMTYAFKNSKPNNDDSVSGVDKNDSGNKENQSNAVNPNKYPNQSSYFAGTVDFTNLALSKKDTELNEWSAINSGYSKFDDGGEDNVTIIATAYTSAAEENGGYEGMNAIGGKLGPGVIAAPKDIKFHTKIRISGVGVFNVEDRGSAIVRVSDDIIRVDVWMDSYREAMKFGKRVYKGRIL